LTGIQKTLNIKWIFLIAFFGEIATGIVLPILPPYAILLNASTFLVSAIASTSGLSRMLSEIYFGNLSDQKGRRPVMIMEACLLTVFPVLAALASKPSILFIVAIMQGTASSMLSLVAVLVGDLTQGHRLNRAMGTLLMVQGFGSSIGSYIGGYVADHFGFPSAFYVSALFALLALGVVLSKVQDSRLASPRSSRGPHYRFWTKAREILGNKEVLVICLLASMTYFAQGLIGTFFPLRGQELGLSETQIGLVLATRALLSTVARLPASLAIGAAGGIVWAILSSFVEAISVGSVAFAQNFEAVTIAIAIQGIGYGSFLLMARALAVSTDQNRRGMTIGLLGMFGWLGQTFLLLVLGVSSNFTTLSNLFLLGSLIILSGTIISVVVLRLRRAAASK
jgi:MFS family permease